MLDYTQAAGVRVWNKIKTTAFVLSILTQICSIGYLVYILCVGNGLLPVNISLLALSSLYLLFYLCFLTRGEKSPVKLWIKRSFKWSKRVVKLFNLGVLVYGIACAKRYSPLAVMLTALLLFIWIIDLLVDILSTLAYKWGTFLFEGMKADYEKISAPVTATKNFFKRIAGKDVEEKPQPTKNRILLDELVAERRQDKREKKANDRREKKEKRAALKAEKKAKKRAHRNPAPVLLDETAISQDEE